MKNPKPKKGSKVLCIAEGKDWGAETDCPPQIGWVYLVDQVERMNEEFKEDPKGKYLGIGLMGFGIHKKDPDLKALWDSGFFRVVGKGKIISAQ